MGNTVTLETDGGLAAVRLSRAHGNAINDELVGDLTDAFRETRQDASVRGVLLVASGKLFCPGLDLQELIELDRAAMERFLERFNACMLDLYSFDKPLVAAIHGHAIAGGCILALTADWRVLREGAMVGLNEVRVGVPFPFGISMMLRESVHAPRLEEVALFGRNYKDREAVSTGLVHELHPAEGFEDHCRGRLEELAGKDSRAFAVTKRYLRSSTVERIRARDRASMPEFIDAWFSEETRSRLQGIVDELRRRGSS